MRMVSNALHADAQHRSVHGIVIIILHKSAAERAGVSAAFSSGSRCETILEVFGRTRRMTADGNHLPGQARCRVLEYFPELLRQHNTRSIPFHIGGEMHKRQPHFVPSQAVRNVC